jgi:hypothetical protein
MSAVALFTVLVMIWMTMRTGVGEVGGKSTEVVKNKIPILFQWRNMTTKELDGWYPTEWDRCFLNDTILQKKSCQRPKPVVGLYCGLGMGQCASPIQSREYFFQTLDGFDNPNALPLTQLVRSLLLKDQIMIFVGDSLMLQTYHAFLCQLSREGISLSEKHIDQKCHQIITAQESKDSSSLLEIHFLRIGTLSTISTCPGNRGKVSNKTGTWPYAKHIVQV